MGLVGAAVDRDLLVRTYFQGCTAREISEADGIPLGTVKTRLRAALIRPRKRALPVPWLRRPPLPLSTA